MKPLRERFACESASLDDKPKSRDRPFTGRSTSMSGTRFLYCAFMMVTQFYSFSVPSDQPPGSMARPIRQVQTRMRTRLIRPPAGVSRHSVRPPTVVRLLSHGRDCFPPRSGARVSA